MVWGGVFRSQPVQIKIQIQIFAALSRHWYKQVCYTPNVMNASCVSEVSLHPPNPWAPVHLLIHTIIQISQSCSKQHNGLQLMFTSDPRVREVWSQWLVIVGTKQAILSISETDFHTRLHITVCETKTIHWVTVLQAEMPCWERSEENGHVGSSWHEAIGNSLKPC